MRHLGPRVATLVDGRMPPAEEERAWAHVHGCPLCAEAVQREGWIKRELAGLSFAGLEPVPHELAGTLRDPAAFAAGCAALSFLPGESDGSELDGPSRSRRLAGLAFLGAGSVSAAMMGVVALGAAPANAPGFERMPPIVAQPAATQGSGNRSSRGATDADPDAAPADPADLARQVASTVLVGMRLGQ